MAQFTVRQGKRYRAKIKLGFFEKMASNVTIANKLHDAGFAEVQVFGSGSERIAEATWPRADVTEEMPDQIKSVTEI